MRGLLEPKWEATIIGHELAQPTAAFEAVMAELIDPKSASWPKSRKDK